MKILTCYSARYYGARGPTTCHGCGKFYDKEKEVKLVEAESFDGVFFTHEDNENIEEEI